MREPTATATTTTGATAPATPSDNETGILAASTKPGSANESAAARARCRAATATNPRIATSLVAALEQTKNVSSFIDRALVLISAGPGRDWKNYRADLLGGGVGRAQRELGVLLQHMYQTPLQPLLLPGFDSAWFKDPTAWAGPNITSATAELGKAYIAKHNLLRSSMELSLSQRLCLSFRCSASVAVQLLRCTTVHSTSSLPTLTLDADHRNSFPLLTGTPPLSNPMLPSAGSPGKRLRALARDMGHLLPDPPSFREPSTDAPGGPSVAAQPWAAPAGQINPRLPLLSSTRQARTGTHRGLTTTLRGRATLS